jgi:uncharacterized protein YdaU (DUF1376 family)
MGAEAFGGFVALLMEAWFDSQGSVPADPAELAVMSRLGTRGWARHGATILSRWTLIDGRFRHELLDEALARAAKKSDQAKKAATARDATRVARPVPSAAPGQNCRKREPEPVADDTQAEQRPVSTTVTGCVPCGTADDVPRGRQKEKEKEKEKEKKKEQTSNGVALSRYTMAFEEFWKAWRALKPKTALNKRGACESYGRALKRGASDGDLLQAVAAYGRYIDRRETAGKMDQREYIPMPETWLNQDRWTSEYPDDEQDAMPSGPLGGRDFYWENVPDPKGDQLNGRVGRFRLGPGGERTGEPFNEDRWREAQDTKRTGGGS